MGGVCSGGTMKRNSEFSGKISGYSGKLKKVESFNEQKMVSRSHAAGDLYGNTPTTYHSGELKPARPAPAERVFQKSSLLRQAGNMGLEVLDTLGSSMSNLNASGGFISGMASRANKVSILAFEVANTIVKGANLLQSLSEGNTQFLKNEILHSEGVQKLVSTDMKELLKIAAADKREEFDVFTREIVRFGNLCKDPQWHNLGRYFQKLDSDPSPTTPKLLKEEIEITMQELTTLAQHTSELYHEFHALDRFEQDYQRKLEEVESLHLPRRGENLTILHSELKHQRKLVRSLKKKSLWSKTLEEVMEKLVDVVAFIHQEILATFGNNGLITSNKEPIHDPERLGVSGLALHYANIINQIDSIVPRPSSVPPNTRDALYHGLPAGVKVALRSRLNSVHSAEELTVPEIKAEMEKTLEWLVPVAVNTTKAHQGFGWVGEWANTGTEFNKKRDAQSNLIRLQTLYHADKQKTEKYILELIILLNRLINQARRKDNGVKPVLPVRSPTRKGLHLLDEMQQVPSSQYSGNTCRVLELSQEERKTLEEVCWRRLIPRISKSQEFATSKRAKVLVSHSASSSPSRCTVAKSLVRRRTNRLDAIDGLDTTQWDRSF